MRPRQLLRRAAIVYDSTVPRARPITDRELTLALLHRQLLLARQRCSAAAAVRRLVALQAQYSLSPYLALHARVDGFAVGDLERALKRGTVVKATLMRGTLHLVHAADYPAFASAWRFQARRMLRGREPGLADEDERIVAALAAFLRQPRTTDEIRAQTRALAGERIRHPSDALDYARLSLPLVHRMPSGLWRQHGKFSLVAWDGPPVAADPAPGTAALVRAYLGAFGPATRGLRRAPARREKRRGPAHLPRRRDGRGDLDGRVRRRRRDVDARLADRDERRRRAERPRGRRRAAARAAAPAGAHAPGRDRARMRNRPGAPGERGRIGARG
jgi:hypothetical protein